MAKSNHTTVSLVDAKSLAKLSKVSQKAVAAFNRLIDHYTTTAIRQASAGMLDMARKHVAAFIARESLTEPPFQPEAAHAQWEAECKRLDDIEIGAMQAVLAFPPANESDIEFKFEYVRAHQESTGDNAFAYAGAYEALCDGLLAARKVGLIGSTGEATTSRVWIGALVYLDEVNDEGDPIQCGGDHVIEGIEGAGIKVDGSPRWYPVTRVTDVLPDFTMGIDDNRHEPDDATLLRLVARMRTHEQRADDLKGEKERTGDLRDQRMGEIADEDWRKMALTDRARFTEQEAAISAEVGYDEAYRLWQAEKSQSFLLQRAILSMPAHTLAGLKGKAEATTRWHFDGDSELPHENDASNHHERSLIVMLADIARLGDEQKQPSRFKGPALPDLSKLSVVSLWMTYKTLSTMRDLVEPLEESEDKQVRTYAEAWADALFGAYADIGEYAVKSGRHDLGLLRAQFAVDFAEGQDVQVVGKDVPAYALVDQPVAVAKAA